MAVMILFAFVLPVVAEALQTTTYGAARDYSSIASENYPQSYPGPDSWLWEWSVDRGLWAVVFLDFDLACAHNDRLLISDPRGNFTFTCVNAPPKSFFIHGPKFRMHLYAEGDSQHQKRGFKCQVLYATSKGALQSKIDDLETIEDKNGTDSDKDNSPVLSDTVIILLLLVIIVPLVVIIVIGGVVLMRRRHHQQSSNSTSVHLNIGAIRRDSSVSYTRHGNGPAPGVPRSRLDSDGSLSPDNASTRPKRPVKRSESNASWAMRAEMNTSIRNGSCSSDGHQGTAVRNFYTPCPGETDTCSVGNQGFKDGKKSVSTSVGCRLSTICEESNSVTKLSASFPVPLQCEEPSLAIANAGYMLMTSCSANYVNCGKDEEFV